MFYFLAYLLSAQYRAELRLKLIKKLKKYVYLSSTIQQRKNFILFCTESIKVNTIERDGIFDSHFMPYLLKLGFTEKS